MLRELDNRHLIILKIILLFSIIIFFKTNFYKEKISNEVIGTIKEIKKTDFQQTIFLKNVVINYKGDLQLEEGFKIKVSGKVSEISDTTLFNLFNYKNYLKSKKIFYQIEEPTIEILSIEKTSILKIKNKIVSKIENLKSSEYIKKFVLGIGEIDKEVVTNYQKIGITHLISISGMHIAVIIKGLKKPKLIIPILIFYLFITNFLISLSRAVIFYFLILIKKKLNLKIQNHEILELLGLIFLLLNPYLIYSISFLFSFTITYFLLIEKLNVIKTSFTAFLASIPILANNFFEINITSPLINLIFIPIFSSLLFPLSLLTIIVPNLDNFLFFLINQTENLAQISTNYSIFIVIKKMPLYLIFMYYFIMLKQKKIIIKTMLLILIIIINNVKIDKQITFIDVYQGDSIFMEFKNKSVLIDTGGSIYGDYSSKRIIPYIKSRGFSKLDYLIITHGDYDHMGEAVDLVNNFKVEKVIFNCGEINELEEELIEVLNKKKIPYYSCIKELNIKDNILYFLKTDDYANENDNSSVIYTELNSYRFLFMGDASIEVEEELIKEYNLQNINVLKVGHHGSKTSSGKTFIEKITPTYSVISVGENNRYGHPNDIVLDNLDNSKIYRTDQNGSIMFNVKKNKLQIEICPP